MIYAVNKRTKAHEVMDPNALYNTAVWEEVHADPDGWIEWQGGECPLPEGVPYETKHESGAIFQGEKPETFGVHWRGEGCDAVTAYRPILDAGETEPPAWDSEGLPPVGCECEVEYAELGNWIRAKVIGYDGPACVVAIDGHGYFGSRNPSEFRPILDTKVSHPGTMAGPDKYRADGGEPPAWDGEGLPPVGSRHHDADGDLVEVVAHHLGHAVCYLVDYADHQYIDADYGDLRPIRSEEDEAADDLVEAIVSHYENPKGAEQYKGLARALYRAGYRKQEVE